MTEDASICPDGGSPFSTRLAGLQAGEEDAWADLIDELYVPLLAFLRIRGASEPEDLLSEVLLHTASGISRFQGDEIAFRAWVFTIARRRLVDEHRYWSRRHSRVCDPADLINQPVPGGDVEAEALANLGTDWVLTLFQNLTAAQRDVVLLRFVAGLAIRDVADALDTTEPAVKAAQRRALKQLRRAVIPAAQGRRMRKGGR